MTTPTRCALAGRTGAGLRRKGAVHAGASPGDEALTIELDSTVCETYGLCKEGAQRRNYAGQRGYHPLLAVAAGTADVVMARLRKGRANTARGAANFLRETISRVRYAGAMGPLTVRADSGFYNHDIVAAWLAVQIIAHNLARWTTRLGLGEPLTTTKTLRRRFFSLAGRITRKARRLTLHLPQGWSWQNQFSSALARLRALPLPS